MSYVVNTNKEILEMLEACGVNDISKLFNHLPEGAKYEGLLDLDEGKSELEVYNFMKKISKENKVYPTIFRGAGAYKHYIPSAVKNLSSLSNFVTSYTPYQPEISQGLLQGLFEYQSMICNITGMDVSNASVYDGATAACEAMNMTLIKNKEKVIVSKSIKPSTMEVMKTYAYAYGIEIIEVEIKDGLTDKEDLALKLSDKSACFYVEQPNYFGLLEDTKELGNIVHNTGSKYIIGCNPISLGLISTPNESGADIAVGEGQSLGLPLSFGGPYYGFIASKKELMRRLPGRIVGQTTDNKGQRGFVLTLQTREQHIRREKASSSICSNQSLCALRSAMYMGYVGPKGLNEIAKRCFDLAHYTKDEIVKIDGFSLKYNKEFFHEFVIKTPIEVSKINEYLDKNDILGGLEISDKEMLVCVTEANSIEDINKFVSLLKEVTL
ncbi:MAG: aminomethyl-transferring glycine dehydrogenase subunit GcvPA [Erysipelotrichaceae bacterium]|nr:aminomethyl-transferring glycine dehydrogenase subunit GcvPA [Erysipelotrichaceae bacterium]